MLKKFIPIVACAALLAAVGLGQSGDEETDKRRQAILEKQLADESPGDAALGREVFKANCERCHVFGAIGTQVGPDLSTLSSRFKEKDVLESVLWPSKTISDRLLTEAGVAVLPGTAFGAFGEGFIRLSFATSQANLGEALGRMERFLAKA